MTRLDTWNQRERGEYKEKLRIISVDIYIGSTKSDYKLNISDYKNRNAKIRI